VSEIASFLHQNPDDEDGVGTLNVVWYGQSDALSPKRISFYWCNSGVFTAWPAELFALARRPIWKNNYKRD